jgi:hypothetical protein
MRQILLSAILIFLTTCAVAAEPIPPNLVGIWTTEGSEFRGEAIMKGDALYLDTDGIGAFVGGDGRNVMGIRIIVTSYNPSTNILTFDLTEYGKVQANGTVTYDPSKDAIFSPKDNKRFQHRSNVMSQVIRRSIGLEEKNGTTAYAQNLGLSPSQMVQPTSTASDPIQENFGARPSPYPGFLALPPEAVPSGFKEVGHHYTKREYTLDFTRMVDGKKIDLNIAESDNAKFFYSNSELVQEFKYQGITGQVYVYHNLKTQETSFNLIWLNPPKQRIAIYLTQTPAKEYSQKDLIKILESMKNVR